MMSQLDQSMHPGGRRERCAARRTATAAAADNSQSEGGGAIEREDRGKEAGQGWSRFC